MDKNNQEELENTQPEADENENPNEQEEYTDEEIPQDKYQDPSLTMQEPEQELEPTVLSNDYRDVKLIELFISLSKFIESMLALYEKIEPDIITGYQYNKIYTIYKSLQKEKNDINFYIINEFENSDYQKNLYSYLLFNKLFAQNVQNFRKYLNLNCSVFNEKK